MLRNKQNFFFLNKFEKLQIQRKLGFVVNNPFCSKQVKLDQKKRIFFSPQI